MGCVNLKTKIEAEKSVNHAGYSLFLSRQTVKVRIIQSDASICKKGETMLLLQRAQCESPESMEAAAGEDIGKFNKVGLKKGPAEAGPVVNVKKITEMGSLPISICRRSAVPSPGAVSRHTKMLR